MRPDTRPSSQKVAAELRAQIMAGLLTPGTQLPSTGQLAERYDTATATIQNAMKILKDEGFVTSRTGAGVYVRDRHPFVVDASAYFNPADRGVTYRLLDVAEVDAPVDVAQVLGEERAILRHRMTLRGDEPLELSWSYYPASFATGTALAGRTKVRGGAPAVLAELGHAEHEFTDRLSARLATPQEAELLELPPGIPVIRQFRVIYSAAARPVEVSILVKGAHMYELAYRQAIPQTEA